MLITLSFSPKSYSLSLLYLHCALRHNIPPRKTWNYPPTWVRYTFHTITNLPYTYINTNNQFTKYIIILISSSVLCPSPMLTSPLVESYVHSSILEHCGRTWHFLSSSWAVCRGHSLALGRSFNVNRAHGTSLSSNASALDLRVATAYSHELFWGIFLNTGTNFPGKISQVVHKLWP
jgi:hypothetical protein